MTHNRAFWFFVGVVVCTSLACNAFAGTPEPTLAPPPPLTTNTTVTPGGLAPTVTLPGQPTATGSTAVPGSTLTPSISGTPGVPTVQALVDLNVRTGPGVAYDTDGFLLKGETAVILGRDPNGDWWKIHCPVRATGPQCWVSGKAQYSAVTATTGVPIAEIPPTPTPQPELLGAIVAYIDNGRLTVLPLDITQSPPAPGTARTLGERTDVQEIFVAPDGRKIAYLAGTATANELRVVNVDGHDDRPLVKANQLPLAAGGTSSDLAVVINQVQWQANSQALAFNTNVINLNGPGAGSQEDLWSVTLSADLRLAFSGGNGGGAFALSGNNQVILSQEDALVRGNLDGSGSEALARFELVNTASEYIYYPQPQWTADHSRAYVSVPSREQFGPQAQATLWQIPAGGTAVVWGKLPGNTLFNPVVWNADGSRLAYVRQVLDGSNVAPMLMLADGNGQNAGVYVSDEQLTFLGWSADNAHFLYQAGDFLGVGLIGQGPVTWPLNGQQIGTAAWLTANSFVVAVGNAADSWTLASGTLAGAQVNLIAITPPLADSTLAVWAP